MFQQINASEARNSFSDLVNQAFYNGRSFMVQRLGKSLAVIIGIDEYRRYEKLRKLLFADIDKIAEDNKDIPEKAVKNDIEEARRQVNKSHAKRSR